jgi:hypothetical protein
MKVNTIYHQDLNIHWPDHGYTENPWKDMQRKNWKKRRDGRIWTSPPLIESFPFFTLTLLLLYTCFLSYYNMEYTALNFNFNNADSIISL